METKNTNNFFMALYKVCAVASILLGLLFIGCGLSCTPGVPASADLVRLSSFAGVGCLVLFGVGLCVAMAVPEE